MKESIRMLTFFLKRMWHVNKHCIKSTSILQRQSLFHICPKCKKAKIFPYAAGITGQYQCSNCGYLGPMVLEIERRETRRKKIGRRSSKK